MGSGSAGGWGRLQRHCRHGSKEGKEDHFKLKEEGDTRCPEQIVIGLIIKIRGPPPALSLSNQ